MKNKKNIVGIIFILCLCGFIQFYGCSTDDDDADNDMITFSTTFGGSSSDCGSSIQQTSDGGYAITGYTYSYGAGYSDVYLIKTDQKGNELWSKTFGGKYGDWGSSVQQTSDGGFVIAGSTESWRDYNTDVYLIKTDDSGNELWSKTISAELDSFGNSVQQTSDSGYIIAGSVLLETSLDVILIKTDSEGNTLWSRTFGTYYNDWGYDVQQTSDGGYVITGYITKYSNITTDILLIKTDSEGNELWTKMIGGDSGEWGYDVQQTRDSGYVIIGYIKQKGTPQTDLYLLKTDSNGNELWSKTIGGEKSEVGYSVQQTSDNGYIVAGRTESFGAGNSDVYLLKTDEDGNELWYETFGGINTDIGNSVQQTSDGGYVITGESLSFSSGFAEVYLIKTDPNGNI